MIILPVLYSWDTTCISSLVLECFHFALLKYLVYKWSKFPTWHFYCVRLCGACLSIQPIQNLCLVHMPIITSLSVQEHQVFGEGHLMIGAFIRHDVGVPMPFHSGWKWIRFKRGEMNFKPVSSLDINCLILHWSEWVQICEIINILYSVLITCILS